MGARARALFALWLCAGLITAAPAFAHVGVETDNARPGAEATVTVHVPNESESADTTKVEVQLPEGFAFVRAKSQRGWKVSAQGNVVTIAGGTIAPGDDRDFALVVRNATEPGEYTFPAIQTYSNGERVRWIGAAGTDKPAPDLVVEGKPVAGSGSSPTEPAAQETASPAASAPSNDAPPSETVSAPPEEQEEQGGTSPALIAVGVVILLGVAASAFFRRRNADDD